MCRQKYRYNAQATGACLDIDSNDERPAAPRDNDLSYWSELGMCYQPEWFPLGVKLPSDQ